MRDIIIVLYPIFLLLLFPFVFIFETTKLLYSMIIQYVEFIRDKYIPAMKDLRGVNNDSIL